MSWMAELRQCVRLLVVVLGQCHAEARCVGAEALARAEARAFGMSLDAVPMQCTRVGMSGDAPSVSLTLAVHLRFTCGSLERLSNAHNGWQRRLSPKASILISKTF